MTYTLFLVLIMVVAFLLILIIMVQNPKGGGLSSSFGGGGTQSLGGVQNTTSFLDKSTWTLSIVLLALILLSNFAAPKTHAVDTTSEIENTIENREVQDAPAALPVETPTTQDTVQ
ncbi:preprotein translocase subunit SecG [Lutibacter sp. A64]|uniref:preprotein translocase subunit SecG n=1 Tax=Lutibacter sp. A64 TaxID=2918526 RepID=UPI001F061B8B|nr:preprotein translocase subunit SecG [Lutibacter sp. A64]UMB52370.1 preprotein translocase subunit SecG [Lutibacter sp. A64]